MQKPQCSSLKIATCEPFKGEKMLLCRRKGIYTYICYRRPPRVQPTTPPLRGGWTRLPVGQMASPQF